ncbi:hypothetical protein B0H13DRAFT_2686469 [Mycena leptocephala]|nr:hypothetical protein B0H13DRAFT_2686469 [Mycena leptocephala]
MSAHMHSTPRTTALPQYILPTHSSHSLTHGAHARAAAATAQQHQTRPDHRRPRVHSTQRNGKESDAPRIHPAAVPVQRRYSNEALCAEVSAHTSRAPALRQCTQTVPRGRASAYMLVRAPRAWCLESRMREEEPPTEQRKKGRESKGSAPTGSHRAFHPSRRTHASSFPSSSSSPSSDPSRSPMRVRHGLHLRRCGGSNAELRMTSGIGYRIAGRRYSEGKEIVNKEEKKKNKKNGMGDPLRQASFTTPHLRQTVYHPTLQTQTSTARGHPSLRHSLDLAQGCVHLPATNDVNLCPTPSEATSREAAWGVSPSTKQRDPRAHRYDGSEERMQGEEIGKRGWMAERKDVRLVARDPPHDSKNTPPQVTLPPGCSPSAIGW